MKKEQYYCGKLSVEEAIRRAKQKCIENYDPQPNSLSFRVLGPPTERKWLEASPPDSYQDSDYRVTVFVREGSPQKGMVIADYGRGVVMAFDAWDNLLFKWSGLTGQKI